MASVCVREREHLISPAVANAIGWIESFFLKWQWQTSVQPIHDNLPIPLCIDALLPLPFHSIQLQSAFFCVTDTVSVTWVRNSVKTDHLGLIIISVVAEALMPQLQFISARLSNCWGVNINYGPSWVCFGFELSANTCKQNCFIHIMYQDNSSIELWRPLWQ